MSQLLRSLRTQAQKIDAGIIIAALLSLFAVQALLGAEGLPTTADLAIHIYRTLEFERAWAPGVIVPRWAPNLAYGYGYPLFVFAPPLPYLLAAGLHLLGLSLAQAFKVLLILILMLYNVGMYLLVRDLLRSVWAGLVAAVIFTYAPFALREALLYGGNVPQYLAIGLFPWALWAASRSLQKAGWRWPVITAIFYAAIILSHLFQALIFSAVLAGYLLLGLLLKSGPLRQRLQPLITLPLGLLLSAFFWLPAFAERSATRAQASIYLQKSPFFVRYPHWSELVAWIPPLDSRAANPFVPLTLGLVPIGLAFVGLLAISWELVRAIMGGQKKELPAAAAVLYLAVVGLVAVFLTLSISRPVWEAVEILQVAEFPWRLLGLANLGLAALGGAAVLAIPRRWQALAASAMIAGQLLAVAPFLYPVTPFTRYGTPTIADQIRYERSSQSIGTTTLGEYLPQPVTIPPTGSPLVDSFDQGIFPDRLDRTRLPAGLEAQLLKQTAVTHQYKIDAPQPFTLRLLHFDYPGWQAILDGQPVAITAEAESGLMLIDIPAGRHQLTIHFGETPVRLAAILLSLLTLVSLLAGGVLAWWRRKGSPVPANGSASPGPKLSLLSPVTLISAGLILAAALWIVPALRPFFTVTSPPDRVLAAQQPTQYRFENGIQLIGYDLSQQVVDPGDYLQVVLYWQTDSAPYRVNLQPFVHLDRIDSLETIADATNYTPGDVTTESNMPTFHWDNSRYIRDEHDLFVPPDAAPLAYAVRVGLIDPDRGGQLLPLANGAGDTIWLDTINVSPPTGQQSLPVQPLEVNFNLAGDSLRLTGFELTGQSQDRLDFLLAWQTETDLEQDYVVFAQLLTVDGQRAAGFDRPPLDGAYPTSTWLADQTIIDPRHIPLADLPAGQYRLIVGLYQAETGQPMTTTDGRNFAELTTLTID